MKKRRFYIDPSDINKDIFFIKEKEKHHLHNVLRLNIHDIVYGVSDNGKEYEAEIFKIDDEKVSCKILKIKEYNEKFNVSFSIMISIVKEKAMSFILEKSTELGVFQIYPLISEKTSIFKKQDLMKKKKRWETIIKSSVKQSGNLNPCKISDFIQINNIHEFNFSEFTHIILLSPCSEFFIEEIFNDWLCDKKKELNFLIILGPEAGFTENEEYLFKQKNAVSICCQREVMKTETGFCYISSIMGLLKRLRK